MVRPLKDLSLLAVFNGTKEGKIENLHILPLQVRQQLWDVILLRDEIYNSNFMNELTKAEFLCGFQSISIDMETKTNEYTVNEIPANYGKLLAHLIDSLGMKMENLYGKTLGESINALKLAVYFENGDRGFKVAYMNTIANLILQCPSLNSLDVVFKRIYYGLEESLLITGGLLNEIDELELWRKAIAKVRCLSLVNCANCNLFHRGGRRIMELKNLVNLKLVQCENCLGDLLSAVSPTLESLYIKYDKCYVLDEDVEISPLPRLKSLIIKLKPHYYMFYNEEFIENLKQCTELEHAELWFRYDDTAMIDYDMELFKKLGQFIHRFDLKVKVKIDDNDTWFQSGKFKMVDFFPDRIKTLHITLDEDEPAAQNRFVSDLGTALSSFENLTQFSIRLSSPLETDINWAERRKACSNLAAYFSNEKQAMKLKKLLLDGQFHQWVFDAIFENCLALESVEIYGSSQIRDNHLIDFASRGGKLFKLGVGGNENDLDGGLMQILVSSGEKLKKFYYRGEDNIPVNICNILSDHCPNLKKVIGMPEEFADLAPFCTEEFDVEESVMEGYVEITGYITW